MTLDELANTGDVHEAFEVVRAFVDAIVWGEHVRVWELFSPEAREHVLRAASRRGLDAVAAQRARQETWSGGEADAFLTSLVHGLRIDLSGVDLDRILISEHPVRLDDGSLRFDLENPSHLPPTLTGGANWAAGAVVVERMGAHAATPTSTPTATPTATPTSTPTSDWRVTRLIARPATRAET